MAANESAKAQEQKGTNVWSRAGLAAIGVFFGLLGAAQMAEGKAHGKYAIAAVEKRTEPVLFWIYIAAHFVIAAWIIVVALKSSSRDQKNA